MTSEYKRPKCTCEGGRYCFAQRNGRCSILTEIPKDGKCAFKKPRANVTNGKVYSSELRKY